MDYRETIIDPNSSPWTLGVKESS